MGMDCGKCGHTKLQGEMDLNQVILKCPLCGWVRVYLHNDIIRHIEEEREERKIKNKKRNKLKLLSCATCKTNFRSTTYKKRCPVCNKKIRKKQLRANHRAYKNRWGGSC